MQKKCRFVIIIMLCTMCTLVPMLSGCGPVTTGTQGVSGEPTTQPTASVPLASNVKKITASTDALYNVYVKGNDVNLIFTANAAAEGKVDIDYTLTNILTNDSLSGRAYITDGKRTEVAVTPPDAGVYALTFTSSCGVATPENAYVTVLAGTATTASERFCADVASTWHASTRERENYIKMLHLAGITHIRERVSISDTYENGSANINAYNNALDALKQAGLDVTITWHDLPDAMKTGGTTNLVEVYNHLKSLVDAGGDRISAWEIWNEQDVIHFGNMYPDEYAAYLKACAIAINDSEESPLKVLGSFARTPNYSLFGPWMMENEVMDYLDVYNFHVYTFTTYGKGVLLDNDAVQQHIDFSTKWAGKIPQWQTETGTIHSEGGSKTRSLDALLQQSKYIALSSICSAAMGVERTYQYLFLEYALDNCLAFFSEEGYAFPAYSAYATLINMLGECEFIGEFVDDIASGYVVQSAPNKQTAMLWATEGSRKITFETQAEITVTDMFGGQTVLSPQDGKVSLFLSNSPVYLTSAEGTLPSSMYGDYSYSVFFDTPSVKDIPAADRIVLYPHFSEDNAPEMPTLENVGPDYEGVCTGYRFNSGEKSSVTITVYNFNSDEATGSVRVSLPDGWQCANPNQSVNVPAGGSQTLTFQLTAGQMQKETLEKIIFSGSFQYGESTRCISWVSGR